SVDSTKIFDFVDEVKSNTVNNALVPFADFGDIESYLRQQWAGMIHSFLTAANEHRRVADALEAVAGMNARIEMLSKQILKSVGTEDAKLEAVLYEEMLRSEAIRDLAFWKLKPTPTSVFVNATFRSCAKALGLEPKIQEDRGESSISSNGEISRPRFDSMSTEYKQLRARLTEILKEQGLTPEEYVKRN
ncbi:MAG: hypothetical protein ACRD2L_07385, partial [Terriglobia bacterium]